MQRYINEINYFHFLTPTLTRYARLTPRLYSLLQTTLKTERLFSFVFRYVRQFASLVCPSRALVSCDYDYFGIVPRASYAQVSLVAIKTRYYEQSDFSFNSLLQTIRLSSPVKLTAIRTPRLQQAAVSGAHVSLLFVFTFVNIFVRRDFPQKNSIATRSSFFTRRDPRKEVSGTLSRPHLRHDCPRRFQRNVNGSDAVQ